MDLHLRTGRYLPDASALEGAVLFLETTEELPSADFVHLVLMCMGERGLLKQHSAVLRAMAEHNPVPRERSPSSPPTP